MKILLHLKQIGQYIKKTDWLLVLPVFLLIFFGLASLYSNAINSSPPNWTFFKKQLFFFGLGTLLMLILANINYKRWKNYAWGFYILALVLLVAVLLWGTTIRGTTGWFYFFGFGFQPVELMKFALVFALANFYSEAVGKEKEFSTVLKIAGLILLPVALAMLQPDFGSAAIMLSIGLAFYLLLSARIKNLLYLSAGIALSGFILWQKILLDYQKNRIKIFINPMLDPLGRGYNIRQSIIAVGSGGWLGRGLGLGTQSQLHFLPEAATDFIFAAIAETLGFMGSSLLILFFILLFIKLIRIIKNNRDLFGVYLVYGFGVIFFTQSIINIGMNIGLLPIVGLSLPFVSYGGSFLIICLASIGIISNISRRQKQKI